MPALTHNDFYHLSEAKRRSFRKYILVSRFINMKHHLLAKFINELRDTAIKYAHTQQLREQIKSTVSNYMDMTIDDNCSLINEWQIQDKNILANALREIYANNGEDPFIQMTCRKALRDAGFDL